MLDGLRPKRRGRELLAQDSSAAEQQHLPGSHHAAGRVVQGQRVVDDVVVLARAHVERGAHKKRVARYI